MGGTSKTTAKAAVRRSDQSPPPDVPHLAVSCNRLRVTGSTVLVIRNSCFGNTNRFGRDRQPNVTREPDQRAPRTLSMTRSITRTDGQAATNGPIVVQNRLALRRARIQAFSQSRVGGSGHIVRNDNAYFADCGANVKRGKRFFLKFFPESLIGPSALRSIRGKDLCDRSCNRTSLSGRPVRGSETPAAVGLQDVSYENARTIADHRHDFVRS